MLGLLHYEQPLGASRILNAFPKALANPGTTLLKPLEYSFFQQSVKSVFGLVSIKKMYMYAKEPAVCDMMEHFKPKFLRVPETLILLTGIERESQFSNLRVFKMCLCTDP